MAYRDTSEVAAAARRMVRAVGNRVAVEDTHDLNLLIGIQDELDVAWAKAVAGLRRSGNSDARIGEFLGISRQAVRQKYPHERAEVGG